MVSCIGHYIKPFEIFESWRMVSKLKMATFNYTKHKSIESNASIDQKIGQVCQPALLLKIMEVVNCSASETLSSKLPILLN